MIPYHIILFWIGWYDMILKHVPQEVYCVVCRGRILRERGRGGMASIAPHNFCIREPSIGSGLALRSPRTGKESTVMRPIARSWSVVLLVGCLIAAVAVAGGQENSV